MWLMRADILSQSLSGAAECRTNAIFRNAGETADLMVAVSFQVVEPHNFTLVAVEYI